MDAGLSLFLALIAFITFGLLWLNGRAALADLAARWSDAGPAPTPTVMSRSGAIDGPSEASAPQTDAPQTPDRPTITRAQILDACKAMRVAGVTREQARGVLRALGLPLDNNVWSEAAPPVTPTADEVIVTPFAGRRTMARHYAPALEYQPPEEVTR